LADDIGIGTHENWVTASAVHGNRLLTSGGQSLQYRAGDVIIWDLTSGKMLKKLAGHESNVWAIAVSPDGTKVVTTAYDGKVIVWDSAAGESLATLEKHKGWTRAVDFAPDGAHFATAGGE